MIQGHCQVKYVNCRVHCAKKYFLVYIQRGTSVIPLFGVILTGKDIFAKYIKMGFQENVLAKDDIESPNKRILQAKLN